MKVRDLITKMSNTTEILVYTESEGCAMPKWGDCKGGEAFDYDCLDCTEYVKEKYECDEYYGTAECCPIKVADLAVVEINNAMHKVQVTPRKWKDRHLIAIRVKR